MQKIVIHLPPDPVNLSEKDYNQKNRTNQRDIIN